MLSRTELDAEVAGCRADVDHIAHRVEVVRFDASASWMSPYTAQVVFVIDFVEPPSWFAGDLPADEQNALLTAPRCIRIAMCMPHGYALVDATGPKTFRFTSPMQIKSSLSSLLLSCSPVYTAHFEAQLAEKLSAPRETPSRTAKSNGARRAHSPAPPQPSSLRQQQRPPAAAAAFPPTWRLELISLLYYMLEHRVHELPLPPWLSALPPNDPFTNTFHDLFASISGSIHEHQVRVEALLVTQHDWAIEKEEGRLNSLRFMSEWMERELARQEREARAAEQERQLAREAAISAAARGGGQLHRPHAHTSVSNQRSDSASSALAIATSGNLVRSVSPLLDESSDSLDLDSNSDDQSSSRGTLRRSGAKSSEASLRPRSLLPKQSKTFTGVGSVAAASSSATLQAAPATRTIETTKLEATLERARVLAEQKTNTPSPHGDDSSTPPSVAPSPSSATAPMVIGRIKPPAPPLPNKLKPKPSKRFSVLAKKQFVKDQRQRETDLGEIVSQEQERASADPADIEHRRLLLEKLLEKNAERTPIRLQHSLLDELRTKSKQVKAKPSEELTELLYKELNGSDEEWAAASESSDDDLEAVPSTTAAALKSSSNPLPASSSPTIVTPSTAALAPAPVETEQREALDRVAWWSRSSALAARHQAMQEFDIIFAANSQLLKHIKGSSPHKRVFRVDHECIEWSKDGAPSPKATTDKRMYWRDVVSIQVGLVTPTLSKVNPSKEHCCFSVITPLRTLDLQANSREERDIWFERLLIFVSDSRSKRLHWTARGLGGLDSDPQAPILPPFAADDLPASEDAIGAFFGGVDPA